MWFKGKETEVKVFFFEDELIADKVHSKSQHGVGAAAHSVTEGLFRHPFPEGRVKKIDEPDDIFGNSFHPNTCKL